jgi:hypothetical protein
MRYKLSDYEWTAIKLILRTRIAIVVTASSPVVSS